jgi:hypothetical protein
MALLLPATGREGTTIARSNARTSQLQFLVYLINLQSAVIFAVLWMLSWMLDDWLIQKLKINALNLQGILCLGFAATAIGLGVMLCRS